jgi:RAD54-like protein 2
MQFRSHVLHSVLEGFVQRRSHLVLQKALPPKEEWVFLVKMTPIQTKLYKEFISYIRLMAEMGNSSPNPIKAFAICCKIWNHPDVLYNVAVAKKEQSNVLDDLEDLAEEVEEGFKKRIPRRKPKCGDSDMTSKNNSSESGPGVRNGDADDGFPIFCNWGESQGPSSYNYSNSRERDTLLSLEWALPALKDYTPNVLENGTKFELLFIIIQETVSVGDKLLVFSQSLLTLDLIEMFLGMKFQWAKNRDYFRLDGSTGGLERERLIKEFNSEGRPELRLFLVSTRAGSLGINLIGANRVVVFDASWNPCHDCQAVCRIYR